MPNQSTGPRSAEGKARSSMNALKSGVYSKSLVIPGEDHAQLDALTAEYYQRFQPVFPEQRDQVDTLVRSTWTLRRLAAAEAQIYLFEMETVYGLSEAAPLGHAFSFGSRVLERLQRMVNANQRNYRNALRELERLQISALGPDPDPATQPNENTPVTPPVEFVSSTSAAPPPATPKPAQQPPKEALPYHAPGSNCTFKPCQPEHFYRCPECFPGACSVEYFKKRL
jgi:hypothetical protein